MKNIFVFICCLFLFCTHIFADNKELFIQNHEDFHNYDVGKTTNNKSIGKCYSCHLFDTQSSSLSKWTTPQSIDAKLQNVNTNNGEPDEFSRACLMCHDGSEASLVLFAPVSPCGIIKDATVSMAGKSSHPIFVNYSNRDDLHNVSSSLKGEWEDAEVVSDILRDNKVVCISCHIPHRKENGSFLRTSTRNSQLCNGCHNK